MDSEPQPLADTPATPPAAEAPTAVHEDDQAAPDGAVHTEDRSTDRSTHTPRGARNGDPHGRPGALPPAPGRLPRARPSRRTVLAAALAVQAAALVVISWQVAADGPLLGLDRWVRHGVLTSRHRLSSSLLDHLGALLSDLGGSVPAVPLLLAGGALAAWRARRAGVRRWWFPLPAAALTAGLIPLLVVPAKGWFGRPGPLGLPLTPEQWGWYPSGHTATAGIAYGAAALLLGRTTRARSRRRLHAGAGVLAAGVGLGLLWSDYHWTLDVVASWCLAGLLLPALALLVARLMPAARPTAPKLPAPPERR